MAREWPNLPPKGYSIHDDNFSDLALAPSKINYIDADPVDYLFPRLLALIQLIMRKKRGSNSSTPHPSKTPAYSSTP